ncbi:hypothetical protein D9M72_548410 [compost metagenome]
MRPIRSKQAYTRKLTRVSPEAMISVRTLKSARVSNTSFHSMRWASIVNSTISIRKNSIVSGRFQRFQCDLPGLLA